MHPASQTPPMWISEAVAAAAFLIWCAAIILICAGLS